MDEFSEGQRSRKSVPLPFVSFLLQAAEGRMPNGWRSPMSKVVPNRSSSRDPSTPGGSGLRVLLLLIAGGLLLSTPATVHAQLASDARTQQVRTPRVFLDCQIRFGCDFDHFRTEIRFVDWVRDRSDADVHVIVTGTGAGGGGMQYTLDFIGLREMGGLDDQLTYTSHGSDVQAETRDGITQTLRLGLIRYGVQAGQGRGFNVGWDGIAARSGSGPGTGEADMGEPLDPWNFWTFRMGLSGNLDLQETRTESRLNPSFGADRVTEAWKINTSLWANFRRDRRELADGREIRNDMNSWRANVLVVRSISDHLSVGVDVGGNNSVRNNQRRRVNFAPAVEYNYYPYAEATRRQLIAHYQVGLEHSSYYEETVFGVTEETVPLHRLQVQYRAREQWGNAGIGLESSQYVHQGGLYNVGINGDLSYRIARGLEFNVSAGAGWVNDNIHTPVDAIPDEDILLGRQSLPSSYAYEASMGFNYRFGSSLANVVNNRFPRSVRGMGGPGGF